MAMQLFLNTSHHQSSTQPSVFREVTHYVAALALPLLLSLVGMGWAVRLVSPRDFGLFNLVSITASIASTASFYWVGQWILRYATQFIELPTSQRYWAVLWRLSFLSTAALFFVGFLVAAVYPVGAHVVVGTGLLTSLLIVQ